MREFLINIDMVNSEERIHFHTCFMILEVADEEVKVFQSDWLLGKDVASVCQRVNERTRSDISGWNSLTQRHYYQPSNNH